MAKYLLLICILISSFAKAKTQEFLVHPLPAARTQGHIAACGSFAVAAALDHKLCQQNAELCKTPFVSVLSILNTAKEDFDGHSDPTFILGYLSGQSIYTEKCRPYETFKAQPGKSDKYNFIELRTGEERKLKLNEYDVVAKDHLVDIYNKKIKWRSDIKWRTSAFREFKSDLDKAVDFDISWAQVTKAIEAVSENEFIGELLFSEDCDRVQLPTLGYEYFRLPVNAKSISKWIQSLIEKNTPIFWKFYPNYKIAPAAHAVLILGYRQKCENKKECQVEYLISDSADGVAPTSGLSWVSQNFMTQKTIEYAGLENCRYKDNKGQKQPCTLSLTYIK